jgi:arginyl-tRNA synthetase
MNIFAQNFGAGIHRALLRLQPDYQCTSESLVGLIETPPQTKMGDYSFPCFTLAKVFRKAPALIANELTEVLKEILADSNLFEGFKPLGPYLNVKVNSSEMAKRVLPEIHNGKWFVLNSSELKTQVMIEFSQPNTHKGFHVGHCRNVALGDSLVRLFRYNGYQVVAANYIGDIGTHIAKCLWYYQEKNEENPPQANKGEWLGELYTASTLELESQTESEKERTQKKISDILAKLEEKDPQISQVWQETRLWSLEDFEQIYSWLGTQFDHIFYESEVDEEGKQLVILGAEHGVFQKSDGAIGIDLKEEKLGFFLLLKSDGNTLYSTKDLALAKRKFEEFGIERSIYVVGAEQTLHFQQVFATLKKMGYEQAERCIHLPYALVVLPEGKMSSRNGNVILFSKLQREMCAFVRNNYLEAHRLNWSDEEIESTTRKVAVAAIKYGMLNQDPNKQITFSLKDWLVSEGDTGVYLIYAYVRIRSIIRQFENFDPQTEVDLKLLEHLHEKALIRKLFDFNDIASQAAEQYRPSLLARTLFELCKDFSRCYSSCSVKHAESTELQLARLNLFSAVAATLSIGLNLLGIEPPERM